MKRQFEMYIEKYWGDYVGGTDESLNKLYPLSRTF